MAELMVTVLGGVAAVDGGSRRRCCDFFFFLMQRPLFFFVSPLSSLSLLCLSSSLPFSLSKTLMFLSFGLSFLPQKRSDSLSRSPFLFFSSLPPVFCRFSSPFFFLSGHYLYGQGERGRPCPVPSLPMHGAHVSCTAVAPAEVANGGVRLRGTTSLSSHHEEVRVASGVGFNRARGERERGRNKRKRTKTYLPLLRVQGKKKEEQCRLKRHCFVFPFFF